VTSLSPKLTVEPTLYIRHNPHNGYVHHNLASNQPTHYFASNLNSHVGKFSCQICNQMSTNFHHTNTNAVLVPNGKQ